MYSHKPIINTKCRSEWEYLIREWVHDEKDRKMLTRFLLDGVRLEPLAEEFDMSSVQCQKRIFDAREQLFKHIPK